MLKGVFSAKITSDYRRIIDDYAKKGYRYAGYIPTKVGCYGRPIEYDLIFEKDKNSKNW